MFIVLDIKDSDVLSGSHTESKNVHNVCVAKSYSHQAAYLHVQ